MKSADEELYWREVESKKGETIKPKSITDLKNALGNIPQDNKQQEEQRRIFMANRAKEMFIYRERIVEATTLEELSDIKALILNRISLMDEFDDKDYPKATETRPKLNNLLRYADSKIANFKPQVRDPEINPKYIEFWMQFTKNNPKTKKSYLAKADVLTFLNQAFGNHKTEKTFNPDLTKKEMYHAAWLFYRTNKKDFKKIRIAELMKKNFPYHFSGDLEKEIINIRDGLDHNKRIFQKN